MRLPSVPRVLLRSRPDGSLSADRVAGILPPVGGGWVPEPDPGDQPGDEADHEVEGGPQAPVARSWDGGRHAPVAGRWRLDPGRGGVAALLAVALVAALVAGAVVLRGRPQEVPVPVVEATGVPLPGTSTPPTAGAEVVVAVGGAVRSPGLVRLPSGSRVDDAVRAAGGALDPAATSLLNLARVLVDGEQVLVGVEAPTGAGPGGGAGAGSAPGGLVDLNLAAASDLDALPGIGPVLAQRIVDWRSENGRFASVDQLREVTGIGESKYEDLRAKVTV